ncbi:MAG: SDR family oxidoreductase [Pseudomonadota bacterium]
MTKVLLVTGGSRGIGAATAIKAAADGFAVAVNYRTNRDAARAVVSTIKETGGKAIAVQADVSEERGVLGVFEAVDQNFGRLDALFNNAGVIHTNQRIRDYEVATLEEQWRVNISSQFLCAREAVKRMATDTGGNGGAIVNMSSAAARIGGANSLMAYAASKGAIDTFTTGLATEVAPLGIRVNAVRPGLIETDIHDDTGDPNRLKSLVGMVPMGRTGTAEEVADLVVYLLSDRASYVTGTHVDVGGGR